jgi:hypothetical protein
MEHTFRKIRLKLGLLACVALAGLTVFAAVAVAANTPSANGEGTLDSGLRTFSFNARTNADGTVTGNATLINRNFTGADGHSPYRLQIDISCMNIVGGVAFFGGTVKSTNDPSLIDAVYFAVKDNGEPGAGIDQISRVAFFDNDPNTTGDPQLCQFNTPNDGYLPLETIESGNIQVRS